MSLQGSSLRSVKTKHRLLAVSILTKFVVNQANTQAKQSGKYPLNTDTFLINLPLSIKQKNIHNERNYHSHTGCRQLNFYTGLFSAYADWWARLTRHREMGYISSMRGGRHHRGIYGMGYCSSTQIALNIGHWSRRLITIATNPAPLVERVNPQKQASERPRRMTL